MQVKVSDLMAEDVIFANQYDMICDLRELMTVKRVHALPIVDVEEKLLGIITSSDLIKDLPPKTLACEVMSTGPVFTVPKYSDIHLAARVMKNHKLHHVVVTHEKQVVGMLSSFDFLPLIEESRFTMKNGPTESKKSAERRV